MSRYLLWRLYAPLASFGEVAVGEQRPTSAYPGKSMVIGLLAAALGIRRDQPQEQAALANGYGVAVLQCSPGRLLRDYHTAQVPSRSDLKNAPHASRRDELLAAPRSELNTILSWRDYREDALNVVAVWERESAPHALADLKAALEAPHFVLYLGRKSCPPALPLAPILIEGVRGLDEAFVQEQHSNAARWHSPEGRSIGKALPVASDTQWLMADVDESADDAVAGVQRQFRHDAPLHRGRWQFAPRAESRREWLQENREDKGS